MIASPQPVIFLPLEGQYWGTGVTSPIPALTGSIFEPCEGDTGYTKEEDLILSSLVGHLNVRESQGWLVGLKGTRESPFPLQGEEAGKASSLGSPLPDSSVCWVTAPSAGFLVIRLSIVPTFPE